MFSELERKEMISDGFTEEEIDTLERGADICQTLDMIPDDVEGFIKEYKSKIPEDTTNGLKALAFAAENDSEFFKKLMALNIVIMNDAGEAKIPEVKTLDGLSDKEFANLNRNFYKTLSELSTSDRKEFIKLISNITKDQEEDVINRLKND